MFDLTKKIELDEKNYKHYRLFQTAVYLLALFLAVYLFIIIAFPTQFLTFSFLNPNSTKNNLANIRNSEGLFPERGRIEGTKPLTFDASVIGNYSTGRVSIILSKKSEEFVSASLNARKSYQAFFYPEGEPVGFRDGTAVKSEGNYYLVSDGKLKKFRNDSILETLGFDKNYFIETTAEDLKYNPKGEEISDISTYPNYSIFKIDNEYYILKDDILRKFVSSQAYLSSYADNQAIEKTADFLKKYPLSDDTEGFADGSLVSYGDSAFLVSNGKTLPIDSSITFENMGYSWDDLRKISGDEMAMYKKEKLFTIFSPHPDGTIFVTNEDQKYYLIKNNQKHSLPSSSAALSWSKNNPVIVSEMSLGIEGKCQLKKNPFSFRSYYCEIPLEKFKGLYGKDFEFVLNSESNIKIDTIDTSFKKSVTLENLKLAITETFAKIKGNYAY